MQSQQRKRSQENMRNGDVPPSDHSSIQQTTSHESSLQIRNTKKNIPNTIENSFNSLKKNMPSLERCCSRKIFSSQKGGYRKQTLTAFKAFLF